MQNNNGFWKHLSTDYDNKTFDTGRVIVITVILSMIVMEGWDVILHSQPFDPQAYGAGVAAILAGLGAYIFGDNSKRPHIESEEGDDSNISVVINQDKKPNSRSNSRSEVEE